MLQGSNTSENVRKNMIVRAVEQFIKHQQALEKRKQEKIKKRRDRDSVPKTN